MSMYWLLAQAAQAAPPEHTGFPTWLVIVFVGVLILLFIGAAASQGAGGQAPPGFPPALPPTFDGESQPFVNTSTRPSRRIRINADEVRVRITPDNLSS